MSTIHFTDRSAATRARPASRALAQAAVSALRAPSILNSQPWRWRIHDTVAELHADRERQLLTVDPDGRLLMVSCGAALDHARTALAGAGVTATIRRFPDPTAPDLAAVIEVDKIGTADAGAVRRHQAIALRATDRRPFDATPVPDEALERLRAAATDRGAHLHILRPEQVVELAAAAGRANTTEFADPAYRAELASWVSRPAASGDGVAAAPSHAVDPIDRSARYAILFTDGDDAICWLAGGEALSAVLLTATVEKLGTSPMSNVIEVPAARLLIRDLLGGFGHPLLALRIGVPAGAPPATTPRRPVHDVIEVAVPVRSDGSAEPGGDDDELGP